MASDNPPLDAGALAMPKQETVPHGDRSRTAAHLATTVLTALGHVSRHLSAAEEASTPDSRKFNMAHARRHVGEAMEHHRKLITVLSRHHPGFGDEVVKLSKTTELPPPPGQSRAGGAPGDYDIGHEAGPVPA